MTELHIIGGTYYESCAEPLREDLFGSGLRAAACLRHFSRVILHTYSDELTLSRVQVNARTFGVKVKISSSPVTPSFRYSHALATPTVTPPFGLIPKTGPISVVARQALCFGMLEGSARVFGKRVVYDPQSAFEPQDFRQTGSTAEHLALVLNEPELRKLTTTPTTMPAALLRSLGAEVVVLKRGSRGATVFTPHGVTHVPAYKTNEVRKLGSGDVFSAMFAHSWAEAHQPAPVAAGRASKAAAFYCNSGSLPLPRDFASTVDREFEPLRLRRRKAGKRPQAYLAGPFFTMPQRWLINEARTSLQNQGLRVFSPMHDVGFGPAEQVAPADLRALRKCDVVLALLDGLDAGTLVEVGHAISDGTPVVGLVQNEDPDDLKMLQGSGCHLVDDLSTAVYHAAWAAFRV